MIKELGYCAGIENYSRYLSGREAGRTAAVPVRLCCPENALLIIDESHVTVPQLGGMYKGDRSRKETLVEYGFPLPSALDNRPLRFDEFERLSPADYIRVSATPGKLRAGTLGQYGRTGWSGRPASSIRRSKCGRPVRRSTTSCRRLRNRRVAVDERVLITTLTKRMAEDLTDYLQEHGVRVRYLHSDIGTVERTEIIRDLRLGAFDVLVGINLLREGPRHAGGITGGDS